MLRAGLDTKIDQLPDVSHFLMGLATIAAKKGLSVVDKWSGITMLRTRTCNGSRDQTRVLLVCNQSS